LIFNREISPEQDNLLLISPKLSDVNRHPKSAQVVSKLQSLFRLKPAVPGSLQSWKEISLYMNRGIRTLQRWEANFGLPVHRPSPSNRSCVFALKSEIDEWMKSRAGNKISMGAAAESDRRNQTESSLSPLRRAA
jgi:hypothetical protein